MMTQRKQSTGSGATDTVDVAVDACGQSSTHSVGRTAAAARIADADPQEIFAVDHNAAVEHNADFDPHLTAAELAVHECSAANVLPAFPTVGAGDLIATCASVVAATVLAAAASWDASCPQSGREHCSGDRIGAAVLQRLDNASPCFQ